MRWDGPQSSRWGREPPAAAFMALADGFGKVIVMFGLDEDGADC